MEAVYDLMMATPEGIQERGAYTWAYDLLVKVRIGVGVRGWIDMGLGLGPRLGVGVGVGVRG